MILIIAPFVFVGTLWVTYALTGKLAKTKWSNHFTYGAALLSTMMYWAWEVLGNSTNNDIRVDLLGIYPLLFGIYAILFWPRFKWMSLGISILGIGINILFFIFMNS